MVFTSWVNSTSNVFLELAPVHKASFYAVYGKKKRFGALIKL